MDVIKQMSDHIQPSGTLDALRGYEGRSAVAFYDGIYEFIPPEYQFNGRNKRPPKDPINALLSFGYTLLYRYMESFILSQGLHPAIGCYHERMSSFSCLASDLMEEFRSPVVDMLVLTIVNRNIIKVSDFTVQHEPSPGCLMSDEARKRFLIEFSKKLAQSFHHPDFSKPVSLAGCMGLQVRRFAKSLKHPEKPYSSFILKCYANEKDVNI